MKPAYVKPVEIATTTSLTVATSASSTVCGTTSATGQSAFPDSPVRYIDYVSNQMASGNTSSKAVEYALPESRRSMKFAAYEMFGQMRNSTSEEKKLYEDMVARKSKPIGVDIFAL
jgi:type IV secretory pathway VirB9-like protein